MKAHVIAPIQERVLSFAIDGAVQPQLSQILQELSIEERPVTMEELGQDVGYLAGFPGFDRKENTAASEILPSCGGVICLCGISNKRMNALLEALNSKKIIIPLKAMVTATNQKWSFAELIKELSREHAAFQKQGNAK